MAQRLNKKLLLGLGSSLGFLGTGVVSGFGINAVVNNGSNFNQDQLALNTLPEADFKTASDYNVATSDMFINTTDLKRFHFGNTQKGQTVTPYGWLGVFEDGVGIENRIALTGWNGEILWVNEDYKTATNANFNVYDMKYDFNTNLIFVLRSGSKNGLIVDAPGSSALTNVQLDILDATTGQKIAKGGEAVNANDFASLQNRAFNTIRQKFLNVPQLGDKKTITNLFQLDVVSISNTKVLVTWMPNFMLLKSLSFQTFPSLVDVIDYFDELTQSFVFEKASLNEVKKFSKNINLRAIKSAEFSPSASSPVWFREWDKVNSVTTFDYVLLANPFFTIGQGNELLLHLILARSKGFNSSQKPEITHKIMGFAENNAQHLGFSFDKSEQIGGEQIGNSNSFFNFLNTEKKMNANVAAWSRAGTFGADFINANLRINRNMFDGNSVVFAYPYAAQIDKGNNNFPIFNVAQLQINPATGLLNKGNEASNKKRNTNWDFGKQIVDHYEKNKDSYNQNNGINKVYPYPNITSNYANLHHNYHRLISVSPFDNTFIYAGKSNLTDQVLEQVNGNTSKYASFWISTNDKFSSGKSYARSLVIGNDPSLSAAVNPYMTDFNSNINKGFDGLYNDGFTFDPRSLENINGGKKSLQLYFNQTGTGKNDLYTSNNFRTSKIGLLDDVLGKANSNDNNNLWVDNIANVSKVTNKNLLITGITLDSYSTLIHSRANLEKWYPKTFWNNTNPGNNLSGNTNLNESNVNNEVRAIANSFGNRLNGNEFDSQKGVDLVSAWKDKSNNGSKNPPNYGRLFVKRPQIKVRNQSIENQLPTETTYPLVTTNFLAGWLPSGNTNRFIFTKQENITNASYQIFSSWKNQVRVNSISGNNTSDLRIEENHTFNDQPEWYDVRKRNIPNGPFGKINNEVQINNKNPLRMVLRISKPTGQLPAWFNKIDHKKFFVNKYPLTKDSVPGETTFETVLQEFINEKSRQIDLGQNSESVAVGLGNLKIDAFLDINPQVIGNDGISGQIFTNGNKRMIVQNQDGQRIIYQDLYVEQWHEIYDQSAINYTDFNLYGFGNKVRPAVQTSWVPGNIPSVTTKIKAFVDANNLPDTLVRKSATEQNIFSFKYKENDRSKLVVTPVDSSWLKNHLLNFQRLIGMQARFEYQQAGNNGWVNLTTTNDAIIKNWWNNTNNTFELPTSNLQNITKLRLVLIPINETDNNNFVQIQNYNSSANASKFISAEQNISIQKVMVDPNWFNTIKLSNDSNSLINLNLNDVQKFEEQILRQSPQIQANNALRSKIKLVYRWNNQQDKLEANQLVNKILTAFRNYNATDSGVFSLWNGENGIKIQATFEAIDSSIELFTPNNNAPNEAARSGFVQSTIKSIIDLGPYLTELRNSTITAAMQTNQPGQIANNSIRFPNKQGQPGQDRFNGLSFTTIQNRLQTGLGVTNHYKKWELNNKNWSDWLPNLNNVNTYNTAKPQIKLGFNIPSNWNVKLIDGTEEITNNTEIDLNLAVPKLVKLPSADQISQLLNIFNVRSIFSGNTFDLTVNETNLAQGLNAIVNVLKVASSTTPSDFNGLENQIVLKFKLGNSDYLEARTLKSWLAQQSTDWITNQLQMRIELNQQSINNQPDFVLQDELANYEFNLLDNQNSHIKIWLHGKAWESALENNGISVQGNRLNLIYQFDKALQTFSNGFNDVQQLALEWRQYNGNSSAGQWTQGALPVQVSPTISKIEVRIAEATKITNTNRYFVYGPQQNETTQKGERKFATINLNAIATVLKINKNWFRTNQISDNVTNLNDLTAAKIREWENKIWKLVPETDETVIRNKVIIKYQFLNKSNLTADTLPQELIQATTDYANQTHHGIVQLWDGGNQNGLRIKATFEKVQESDSTIQFANLSGQIIDGVQNKNERTDDVHTGNVRTTLNLSAWVNNLINNPTVVNTTQPGTIPVNGLTPPQLAGQPNSALFAGAVFNDIENWLKAANVNVFWAKNLTAPVIWNPTNATTSYDPKLGLLYLALENKSNNLNLMIDNSGTNIAPNNDNRQKPLTITLQAPKVLTINANDFNDLDQAFSGNTKFLAVNQNLIAQKIKTVLNRHGNAFANAPLTMEFQVGQGPWINYQNLTAELAKAKTDLPSGAIMARFALQTNNGSNEWSFDLSSTISAPVFTENNSPIKIFINDQGIYEALKDETTLTGSNQALQIQWPKGWVVNNDGILNAGQIGHGLKLEFSFSDLNQAITAGSNIETDWVSQVPKNFNIKFRNLYVRLQVSDTNKFVYEKIVSNEANSPVQPNNQSYKFALDLTKLKQIIELDGLWLNQVITANDIDLVNFSLDKFNEYEKLVFNDVKYDQSIKEKIQIVYEFNNKTNLTKEILVTKIQEYKQTNSTTNTSDFGILKLWNQNSGQKIIASFSKKESTGNYDFVYKDPQKRDHILDTAKVISTVDLKPVVTWLKTIRVNVSSTKAGNTITSLTFPQIIAAGSPFDQKQWPLSTTVLKKLGVVTQYQIIDANTNNPSWSEDLDSINKYDDRGQFKVRFVLKQKIGNNLKVLINNTETLANAVNGDQFSNEIIVNLAVAKVIKINPTIINQEFINNNAISGNTKNLTIDSQKEQKMIEKLLDWNQQQNPNANPAYPTAQLQVLYLIGRNPNTNNANLWKPLNIFISDLANINQDQESNQINFRFKVITPNGKDPDFLIDENQIFQLNPHEIPSANTKIKYFVNKANWETNADQISLSGINTNINWNLNAFGSGKVEENGGIVYLRTNSGRALQLQFTTKSSASYNDSDVANSVQEISTKWVKQKPTRLPANTQIIKVRIVESDGYYYEPAHVNDANSAKVHDINFNVQLEIRVDSAWLNQFLIAPQQIEIKTFDLPLIQKWITDLRNQIKTQNNNLDEVIVNKIDIEFSYNGSGNFTAEQLINKIQTELKNYNGNELGIIQLWNGSKGSKIKATFKTIDPAKIILKDLQGGSNFSADLNTANVYTEIDLSNYTRRLMNEKTSVTKADNNPTSTAISNFMPPDGADNSGFLNGKTYEIIAQRLRAVGINIKFSETGTSNWVEKTAIKKYVAGNDPKLFIAFYNEIDNNIKLKITVANNQSFVVQSNSNSEKQPIGLPLAVPKQISVLASDFSDAGTIINFDGNTRDITFNPNATEIIVNKILTRNGIDINTNPKPNFLKIHFRVGGNNYQYKELNELKQYLKTQPDNKDFTSRAIDWEVFIDPNQNEEWIFTDNSQTKGNLANEQNSPIKIFINNQNIFEDLSETIPTGNSDNFQLPWKNNLQIDSQTGTLTGQNRGFGLKVEFTFKTDLMGQPTDPIDTDWYNGWSPKTPTKFKPGIDRNLFLRLQVSDSKYFYEKENQRITLDLSLLKQIITLNTQWLDQEFLTQTVAATAINDDIVSAYETKVQNAMQIENSLKTKVALNYSFNNQIDLDKAGLIKAIKDYAVTNANDNSLGILQLYNGVIGKKIQVHFAKANPSDESYDLKFIGSNNKDLDTSKAITTIDFSSVIKWLTETSKLIYIEGNANNITKLEIPNVKAPGDSFFNNKQWVQVVNALQDMGITTEYREMLDANLPDNDNGWSDKLSAIKKYNENIGKIQIRFKFNAVQAKNIKFKTSSTVINDGATTAATNAFSVNLNIRLTIQIDSAILSQFINQSDVISGNTKYLRINETHERTMINAIKTANQNNNSAFIDAQLIVKYKLANQPEENWDKLNDFVSALRIANIDQTSNKVLFRFEVENPNDFQVETTAKTLFNPQNEPDRNNWKVKFYINNSTWEGDADTVEVTGKTSQLKWIWNNLQVQDNNNQVGTDGLQVEFTTKADATYDDPIGTNNPNDLTTKWITLKPNQIAATTQQLLIRLKAKAGYVYGPADNTNGNQVSAKVHKVKLSIKREILVNPDNLATTLTIAANSNFVNEIQESDLVNFINNALNGIESTLKKHVTVKFNFNNQTDLTSKTLYAEIKKIIDSNQAPNYGILQLWNNVIGTKIQAHYALTNPDDEYELVAVNGNPDALKDVVTAGIKTKVDLIDIIDDLIKNKKINFTKANKQNRTIVAITNWQMPNIKEGDEALNGLTWDIFENRLKTIGVLIEARVVRSPDETNPTWKPLAQIKEYDDSTLQLAFRFRIEENKGSNIVLSVFKDADVDPTKNPAQLISPEFRININAPATVTVNPDQLQNFQASNKIGGNTKFISLDMSAEKQLIQTISTVNEAINSNIFHDLKNRLYVEYYLGDNAQGTENNQWKTADDFKEFLKNQGSDQLTNQIWYRLNVHNEQSSDPNYQIFNINQDPHILAEKAIGQIDAKVKIFIHQHNYEVLANQIRVRGTNNKFNWIFPANLTPNNQGTFDNIAGLRIQYSTQKGITNKPYVSNGSNDPTKGWSNQQPVKIDPKERYLVVQLVAGEGYVYQAQYDQTTGSDKTDWGIHEVNLDDLKSEIKLSNSGLDQIIFQSTLPDLAVVKIKEFEIKAKENANFENPQLQSKVKIEYQMNWGADDLSEGWKPIDELAIIVQNYMNNFANKHAGLLKFNGFGTTVFATIKARFVSDDSQFIVIDQDANNNGEVSAQNGKTVKTDQLISPINLKEFRTILETTFVTLTPDSTQNDIKGFVPPGMETESLDIQFGGKSFDEISQLLNAIGLIVEYMAPQADGNENWVSDRKLIKQLNNRNELYLRFRIDPILNGLDSKNLAEWAKTFAIKTKTDTPEILDQTNQYATEKIKLKVNLPILITTNANLLKSYGFEIQGNTWQISNVQNLKQLADNKITELLISQSSPTTNLQSAPLKIQFSLGDIKLENNQQWFTIDELAQKLMQIKNQNFNTNEIKARWFIDENQEINGQRYQISDGSAIIIQNQNNTTNALLKMYIHEGVYSNQQEIVKKLVAQGSTEDYQIRELQNWNQMVLQNAFGLKIQLSNEANAQNWINWNQNGDEPKPLNPNKDLWFRYHIKAGYEFAKPDPTDSNYTEKIKLNTDQIKIILKLQSNWLKLIKLTGNLKSLIIDEDAATAQLIPSLPQGQIKPIIFEYTIDGQNWLKQAAFQTELAKLAGKKDQQNFILKREEIKVRFAWNKDQGITDNQYGMMIDQVLIDNPTMASRFYTQLINDDETLNQAVQGYISIKNLPDFAENNFQITGSTSKPNFVVTKRNELNTAFMPYVNLNLFDILYSTNYDKNNKKWIWNTTDSVLKNGQLINQNGLIEAGAKIGPDKKFALKFISKNLKYDVYDLNDQKQDDGYILDLSDQVKITIEITNPFKTHNKTLALWFTADQNRKVGKYYQGEGGFKIVNGTKDGLVDQVDFISALKWLQSPASGLQTNEIEALEFVYHIYDNKPDEEEIKRVSDPNLITNYRDETWKPLEPVLDTNGNDHFTKSLKLKVGQYVSVALRIKEKYANGENNFVLADSEHSFMRPFNLDQSQSPGRVHGYMVNTNLLEIEQEKIVLENMLNTEQLPLDGYTNIKSLNLKKDEVDNYIGVDLELELFHEFYRGSQKEKVIITPFDKIKLIKRQENNNLPTDYFKDADGNEITDQDGKPIPILLDQDGKPTNPKEQNNPGFKEKFINYGEGLFGLSAPVIETERNQWGIFKNETVKIVFQAREGQGGPDDPDFILDQEKSVDLKKVISPQIKFPIFNQDNIKYKFNYNDFAKDEIEYENAFDPSANATEGKSRVKTLIKLIKTSTTFPNETVIGANNVEETIKKLQDELDNSFAKKLMFETIYEKTDGGNSLLSGLELYKLNTLKNNDRIKVRIVSADPDFIWAEPPKTLIINVSGLTAKAPDRDKLRFLRVEQSGQINGQGSFKILVNNPKDNQNNTAEILQGWKFLVRVWNQKKEIKYNWTDDQSQIVNLENGDKVEWKLVDEFSNPVDDAYYNTVAGKHKFNPNDGTTELVFNEVNYPNGKDSAETIFEGIGKYPKDPNKYPSQSGFVISGLQDALEIFEISDTAFAKVMARLEPHYVGLNGQGTINFKEDYLNKNYYVNSLGELYEKPIGQPIFKQQVDDSVVEISLVDFLANTTFYTSDPNLINYQNGFKFLGNDTNLNNHLSNGDQVWAQFDLQVDNNEVNRGISTELNPVTGLKDVVTDPMTPLWYILMAIGGVVTLGGLSLLILWIKRNRKLQK